MGVSMRGSLRFRRLRSDSRAGLFQRRVHDRVELNPQFTIADQLGVGVELVIDGLAGSTVEQDLVLSKQAEMMRNGGLRQMELRTELRNILLATTETKDDVQPSLIGQQPENHCQFFQAWRPATMRHANTCRVDKRRRDGRIIRVALKFSNFFCDRIELICSGVAAGGGCRDNLDSRTMQLKIANDRGDGLTA